MFAGRHISCLFFFFKYSMFLLALSSVYVVFQSVVQPFSHTVATLYNNVPICHMVTFLF